MRTIKDIWAKLRSIVKYLDFGVQTLFLGITVLEFYYRLGGPHLKTTFRVAYMMFGPWQLLSSLLLVLAQAHFFRARCIHLGLSIVYLVVLWNLSGQYIRLNDFTSYCFLIIPGLLAAYYYGITARWAFYKPATRGFLRHISF